MGQAGGDESLEERVGGIRLGLEFRMVLTGEEPRVIRKFYHFHKISLGGRAGDDKPSFFHRFPVGHVELIPMPVAFEDFRFPIDLVDERVLPEDGRAGAQAHGGTFICYVLLFLKDADHRVRCSGVKLRAIRGFQPTDVPRKFDRGHLHAKAEPEEWGPGLPRVAHGLDLALNTPVSEPPRH